MDKILEFILVMLCSIILTVMIIGVSELTSSSIGNQIITLIGFMFIMLFMYVYYNMRKE